MNVLLRNEGCTLETQTAALRERLAAHRLYRTVRRVDDVVTFVGHHVYAVWDFMSLLKALQRSLTCVEVPWVPRGDADTRYLVNEIVVAEESDLDLRGRRASHFEMYLGAMHGVGASTAAIESFVARVSGGVAVAEALRQSGAPEACRRFVTTTMGFVERGRPHEIAAVFTYGREDVIPTMFLALLDGLPAAPGVDLGALRHYLLRHVEVDGGHHGPLARRMVATLCAGSPDREGEAAAAAREALEARLALWDAIADACERRR